MINTLIENLTNVLHALALLGVSWLADTLLSTYRNIGILSQEWDKTRFFNSIKRLIVLLLGIVLMVVVITDLPIFISETGITIPEEYMEALSMISILLAILITAAKYIGGAIEAFFSILNYKKLIDSIEDVVIESGEVEGVEVLVEPESGTEEFVDENYIAPEE